MRGLKRVRGQESDRVNADSLSAHAPRRLLRSPGSGAYTPRGCSVICCVRHDRAEVRTGTTRGDSPPKVQGLAEDRRAARPSWGGRAAALSPATRRRRAGGVAARLADAARGWCWRRWWVSRPFASGGNRGGMRATAGPLQGGRCIATARAERPRRRRRCRPRLGRSRDVIGLLRPGELRARKAQEFEESSAAVRGALRVGGGRRR